MKKKSELSDRIASLRKRLISTVPEIFAERAQIVTQSYLASQGQPFIVRRADAFTSILKNLEIGIAPGEIIVGATTCLPRGCQVFPEYDMKFVIDELDAFEYRTADQFYVTEENKEKLRDLHSFWKDNSLADCALNLFDEEQRVCANDLVFILTALRSGVGHVIIDYQTVLQYGIDGIKKRIKTLTERLNPNAKEYTEKKLFYAASLRCCDAIISFADRYAVLAETLAEQESNITRKSELLTISNICRQVPMYAARNFQEALQSFWFIHVALHLETNGHSFSPGRFDQYMYPYFKDDRKKGIPLTDLTELLLSFWLKFFEINKVRDKVSSTAFGGYPMFQNLILGGQDEHGRSAVNELSYLCLKATEVLHLPQPSLSVRWFFGLEDRFFSQVFDVISQGMGMPAIFNDEVLIPNMLQMGYTLEESRDYGIVGCTETTGQGNVEPWLTGGFLNALKILELTIFNGIDPFTKTNHQFQTGDVESMDSFEVFFNAYKLQLTYYLGTLVAADNILDSLHGKLCPVPYQSLFIKGCLETGATSLEGGALYNSTTIEVVGVPNAADSIFAIKKIIYEEKTMDWDEIKASLLNGFSGAEDFQVFLRQRLEKYGNDNNQVDEIGSSIVDELYNTIQEYRSPRGGAYRIALYSVASHVLFALKTGATPDGRSSNEVLADGGVSCSQGRDVEGLTALFNSVVKLDPMKALGSCLLNVRLSPKLLQGENKQKLINAVKTFFLMKGQHVQCNVFDSNMLKDAQKNPQNYPSLMVRVAGFSVLFNTIDPILQSDIIARTEHSEGANW